jgi:hypothetical protein
VQGHRTRAPRDRERDWNAAKIRRRKPRRNTGITSVPCFDWARLESADDYLRAAFQNHMKYGQGGILADPLGCIMGWCHENGLPPLTALVVNGETGLPEGGLYVERPGDLSAAQQKGFRIQFGIGWLVLPSPARSCRVRSCRTASGIPNASAAKLGSWPCDRIVSRRNASGSGLPRWSHINCASCPAP